MEQVADLRLSPIVSVNDRLAAISVSLARRHER